MGAAACPLAAEMGFFMSFNQFVTDYGVFLGNFVLKMLDKYSEIPAQTQEERLLKILKDNKECELGRKYGFKDIHSFDEFQEKVPISDFDDYAPLVDRMLETGEQNIITSSKIIRYTSSSGSVGKPKIQPKTARDLWNMQCNGFAATPATAARWFKQQGLLKKLPGQMGPLVVDLNGHPVGKDGKMCNGAAQVPFYYVKPLMKNFTTTPMDILFPEDNENTDTAYYQLRFALAKREKVTYLGSIVITLLTGMFEYFEANWEMICDDIEKGTVDPRVRRPASLSKKYDHHFKPDKALADIIRAECKKGFDTPDAPIAKRIWPNLTWGYGMIGSTLSTYVEKLRRYTGNIPMHNMGYAASEGFFAIPVELNATDYALLARCEVFEFLPVDAPEGMKPLKLHEIEVGKDYEIIITNFSGLYRYRICDVVHVTGMYKNVPKVEFLYRTNMGLNLANEKTTTQMLDYVADAIEKKYKIILDGYSFFAEAKSAKTHYVMLIETKGSTFPTDKKAELEAFIDEEFKKINEKYEKYRKWGMIFEPEVLQLEDGTNDAYKQTLVAQGKALNQIKPVTVINNAEREEFFFGKVKK